MFDTKEVVVITFEAIVEQVCQASEPRLAQLVTDRVQHDILVVDG